MLTTIQQTNILTLRGLQCSTAHITEDDNALLYRISHCQDSFSDGEWLLFTGTGYLMRLDAWTHPVLRLRQLGFSKACRRLVTTLMKRHGLTYLHIDALGDVLPGFATFYW
ncbi:TPA: hypothetical protein PXS16_000139 [Yersinia enterocolitica]|uniref:DUF5983 family protein n=1 Tax=Yersinia TaxID=629 RepID=UPI0005E85C75|nr:DUF5983 family protein [Yersinia enterocolitica]CQH43994.1 Uncharacterised protein [Yersinia enterocolitica]HDL8537618.1 hypothetical protein [Yersinia enterocolitica]HDL8753839.1 hypothetical protein [Yersinia enterocolitica]